MLKQRLLTSIALIPLVVISVLYLATPLLQLLLAIVVLLAVWEWFGIIGFNNKAQRVISMVILVLIGMLTLLLPVSLVMYLALAIWTIIAIIVIRYAHRELSDILKKVLMQPVLALTISSLILVLFWYSAGLLHTTALGSWQLLYLLILVWLADIGAYFAGKRWGQRALAKVISPNKTWEGVGGALVLCSIWSVSAYAFGIAGSVDLLSWLVLSLLALVVSIVGDLLESLYKRHYKVKDSGNLLPGHGGILDRIDGLLAALPVFTIGLIYIGAIP